jgi:hypothetical protein
MGCHSSSAPAPVQPVTQPVATTAAPAPKPVAPPRALVCAGVKSDDSNSVSDTDPFYMLMQSKLGGWVTCSGKKLSKTDEEIDVTFPQGGKLTYSFFPSSDSSAVEAVVNAGSSVTRDDVINVLKQDNPTDGCGIDWSQLSAGGPSATGDFKTSGTTCTMDLHVKMDKGSVVGFGFDVAA